MTETINTDTIKENNARLLDELAHHYPAVSFSVQREASRQVTDMITQAAQAGTLIENVEATRDLALASILGSISNKKGNIDPQKAAVYAAREEQNRKTASASRS